MAEKDFSIGQGDTGPVLEEQLIGPDGVTPLDLRGGSCEFRMAPRDQSLPAIVRSASLFDAQNGIVRYDWSGGTNFGYQQSWWLYGWIATLASGQTVSVPDDLDRLLYIKPKIV